MSRLKNITLGPITLQMFNTATPSVAGSTQEPTLSLKPGEDVDETLWLVESNTDPSYNAAIIDSYIQKNILTRTI
jgi:hypothetical protein